MHNEIVDQQNEKAWALWHSDVISARALAHEALQHSIKNVYASGQAFSCLILSACCNNQSQFEEALNFANKVKDIGIEAHLRSDVHPYLYINYGIAYRNLHRISEAEVNFKKALEEGTQHQDYYVAAAANNSLGQIYRQLGDFSKALSFYLQSLQYWENQSNSKELAILYNHIAALHEKQNNLDDALLYHNKSLFLKREINDKRGIAHVLNNIAIVHSKQKDFLKAHENYSEALKIYEGLDFKQGIAFTNCNIADAYIHSGEPQKAVPHLLKAIGIFRELSNSTHLAIALTNLTTAYSKAGELLKAEELLPEIEELLKGIEAKAVSVEIHRDLSHVYEALGDVHRSLGHCREYHRLDKEIFNEESDRRLKNIQIIHQVEQMQKDKEKAELEAEKLKAENDFKAKELTTLALHLVQKNNLIENISREVKDTLSTLDDARRKLLNNVLRAIRETNIRESDWKQFEEQFLKVHGEFIRTLSQQHPDLSAAELKVCALLKLQLANKQIATLLNISLRTVEFHRLNIRKKISLPEKGNLILYLQNL